MSKLILPKIKEVLNLKAINRKKLIIVLSSLGIVLLFALALSYASGYDKIYPNTYIGETNIGGLTYEEAKAEIQKAAESTPVPKEISFSLGSDTLSVKSADIGLKSDIQKTLDLAMGNRKAQGFFTKAVGFSKSLVSENRIYTSYSYDTKKLNGIISEFASPYETQPVDAKYTLDGDKLIITRAKAGEVISLKTLSEDIAKYIENPSKPIALKLEKTKEKDFDTDTLYSELTSASKDAYFARDDNGNVIVVPDKPQIKIEKKQLEEALKSKNAKISVKVGVIPAKVTEKALNDALFSGVMGKWTSYFSAGNIPRSTNVALAAQRINNTVLLPGESFSYDKTIGKRNTQNGYKVAGVYINNKVEQGIGGGICQTSSTLYSAVLYANLEIVSRTSHSLPVSYMPAGQDATIAEGAIDFVFKNNTDYPVKILAEINGGSVTCQILGTPVSGQKVVIYNSTTAVHEPRIEIATDASVPKGYKKTVLGSRGSSVASTRTVYQNGSIVKTERLTNSRYNATSTVITVNPEDKNTPPENLTEYSSQSTATPPEVIEEEGRPAPPTEEADENEIIEI